MVPRYSYGPGGSPASNSIQQRPVQYNAVEYNIVPYSTVQIGHISLCSSAWRTQPKLDAKLDELQQFMRKRQQMLAARRGTILVKSFRQKRKKERASGATPPTRRPRTSATDVEGSFNCYGKEGLSQDEI